MRILHNGIAGLVALCIGCAPAFAIDPAQDVQGGGPPPVPPAAAPTPLKLTDAQRSTINQALRTEHTEVEFHLKSTKPSGQFEPKMGARLPAAVPLNALPRPLIYKIPILRQYSYVKFKHNVLIVNGMTREIVDMFPES